MKLLIVLASFLAAASVSALPAFPNQDEKFAQIRQRAEEFYKTLPKKVQEDAKLLVPELIQKYGYPCEKHTVTSSDGYILEMHRIPYGSDGPSENRPAIYLQHGLLMSSADWVVPGPGKGLAYLLADAGYDVWMPNVRGTKYSKKHVKLDPKKKKKKFWNFSWHEIAMYDVSAMIDYTISQTKQEKLLYIGHSQGTTVFYVLCSEKPEYNNKIKAAFHLAPIGYMAHMFSPILRIASLFQFPLELLDKLFGVYELLPSNALMAIGGDLLCSDGSIFQVLCTNTLFVICGFNEPQMNKTLLPVMMAHTPGGCSTKQIFHYSQEINSGKFRQWDYGFFGNMMNYGRGSPPDYKLKKVTAPVYLYYSGNDWLSSKKDVEKLSGELGNLQEKILVPDEKFNHLDYNYAIDAPTILYNDLIERLKQQ